MYIRTSEKPGQALTSYLYDSSLYGVGKQALGQPALDHACPSRFLSRFNCVPHQHMPRTCTAGSWSTGAATIMKPSAMNPGFITATDALEYDTVLDSHLRTLLLATPRYAAMLADKSKEKGWATERDRVRVALVDLSGDKLCKPGLAEWGATIATISGSTAKVAMLYAAHQLIFDLDQLALTNRLGTAAEVKKKAMDELWSQVLCPPDLDWLVKYESDGSRVHVKASNRLTTHLSQMVERRFSDCCSVPSANELIIRLGFEYINSVLWQSGLRHPQRAGMWIRNTYLQSRISPKLDSKCHSKIREGAKERVTWNGDPTDDPGLRLTALSVATFFTLLAQRRLVNEYASERMERLLKEGCMFPFNPSNPIPTVPDLKVRATKCGLTSEVMHVAALLQSTSGNRRYALTVLVLREGESRARTIQFLKSFVKDVDKLIKQNNP